MNTILEVVIVSSLDAASSDTIKTVCRLARCIANKALMIPRRFSIVALRESLEIFKYRVRLSQWNKDDAAGDNHSSNFDYNSEVDEGLIFQSSQEQAYSYSSNHSHFWHFIIWNILIMGNFIWPQ